MRNSAAPVQTGTHRYLAQVEGRAVGYVDCGIFDRCTVYGGDGPTVPIIIESIDVVTGSIALVVDPELRRRGLGGSEAPDPEGMLYYRAARVSAKR